MTTLSQGVHHAIARVEGIHHVTAFAGDPARNRSFYTDTLGLALVKRTVNFDAPSMWHLYYGCAGGAPGTLLTHFPQPGAPRAMHGGSEIQSVTLAVNRGGLAGLEARLASAGVGCERKQAFGLSTLCFEDPDGMRIMAEEHGHMGSASSPISASPSAPIEIARVSLAVPDAEATTGFLIEKMGFAIGAREDATVRLVLEGGGRGREIDVIHAPHLATHQPGAGAIHHVAWRARDDAMQARARTVLLESGVAVTGVRDRSYFRSIYFMIPGGILFEIATDGPGFTVDEPTESLGTTLCLPPQFEGARARIASSLAPIDTINRDHPD